MRRVLAVKSVLWFILGMAAVVTVLRFARGLGVSTALTDLTPWGFWIGFDVMGGVALAAGGFVVAATVHVFHLERYHAIVRPAVLTAFLGYLAVVVALLFDLGLPWNIWHLVIYWNPHSPLFEVGWCVMLYLTVLALELAPVVLEAARHPLVSRVHAWLKRLTVPLVIVGIALSTLHQSSLGSLLLMTPHRLPPLWYTPVLPVLFFVSAVALGLLMVTVESLTSAWLYEQEPERELVAGLAKAAAIVLWLLFALRIGDLAIRDQLAAALAATPTAHLFQLEVLISTLAPAVLLSMPSVRRSPRQLGFTAFLGVAGFVTNRLDAAGIATVRATGTSYSPSWSELVVSLGVVALAVLAYLFVAEHFHLLHAGRMAKEKHEHELPGFDGTLVARIDPARGGFASFSLAAVLGAGLALAFFPNEALSGMPYVASPVEPTGFADHMLIDANRRGEAVVFDHLAHVKREGGEASCGRCHHLLRPGEQATGCSRCHRDMWRPTSTFDHALHAARLATGGGCPACHVEGEPKDLDHGKPCLSCHAHMVAAGTPLLPKAPPRLGLAVGYVDAAHGLCVRCHEERAPRVNKPTLARCDTCHDGKVPAFDPSKPDERRALIAGAVGP